MAVGPKRLGLFGGTFDPPHVGHMVMARAAQHQLQLDEIWWIPAKRPPHKQGHALSGNDQRMAMTRTAVMENPRFKVLDMEVQRPGVSYTIDTVTEVHAAMPQCSLFLLVGQDSWAQFSTWHRPKAIKSLVNLVVFPRRDTMPLRDEDVLLVKSPCIDVSASDIRRRVRAGLSVRHLVTEPVCAYIAAHGLYIGT